MKNNQVWLGLISFVIMITNYDVAASNWQLINPPTYDDILIFVTIGVIGLIGIILLIVFGIKKGRKR